MENSRSCIFCTECQTRLKRQILGSNVFYYCRNCGYLSSEANFCVKTIAHHTQEPLSTQRPPYITDLKCPEDARKTVIEA